LKGARVATASSPENLDWAPLCTDPAKAKPCACYEQKWPQFMTCIKAEGGGGPVPHQPLGAAGRVDAATLIQIKSPPASLLRVALLRRGGTALPRFANTPTKRNASPLPMFCVEEAAWLVTG
jgi:hypothetical protein